MAHRYACITPHIGHRVIIQFGLERQRFYSDGRHFRGRHTEVSSTYPVTACAGSTDENQRISPIVADDSYSHRPIYIRRSFYHGCKFQTSRYGQHRDPNSFCRVSVSRSPRLGCRSLRERASRLFSNWRILFRGVPPCCSICLFLGLCLSRSDTLEWKSD